MSLASRAESRGRGPKADKRRFPYPPRADEARSPGQLVAGTGNVPVSFARGCIGPGRRCAAAPGPGPGGEARPARAAGRGARDRRATPIRLPRRDQARERARRVRARRRRPETRWTSAPRRAASPTACCSAAPRTWWRSTSRTVSSTGDCDQTRGCR